MDQARGSVPRGGGDELRMSAVLGVSAGSGAVRIAKSRSDGSTGRATPASVEVRSITTAYQRVEDLVADAVDTALESSPPITATAVSYRGEPMARALRSALARRQLTNYELVPETTAALELLNTTGEIRGLTAIAMYDLGSSGLTVSVLDTVTGLIHHTERSEQVSGDLFDALIREQQIASGRITAPRGPEGFVALDARCRQCKEQLSLEQTTALASDTGIVLLSRARLEELIGPAIKESVQLALAVIERSGRSVQALVAIGGGARIPLVQTMLSERIGIPLVLVDGPETVAARGAALLARPPGGPAMAPIDTRWALRTDPGLTAIPFTPVMTTERHSSPDEHLRTRASTTPAPTPPWLVPPPMAQKRRGRDTAKRDAVSAATVSDTGSGPRSVDTPRNGMLQAHWTSDDAVYDRMVAAMPAERRRPFRALAVVGAGIAAVALVGGLAFGLSRKDDAPQPGSGGITSTPMTTPQPSPAQATTIRQVLPPPPPVTTPAAPPPPPPVVEAPAPVRVQPQPRPRRTASQPPPSPPPPPAPAPPPPPPPFGGMPHPVIPGLPTVMPHP